MIPENVQTSRNAKPKHDSLMSMYEVVRPVRQADAASSSGEGPALHIVALNQQPSPSCRTPVDWLPGSVDAVLPALALFAPPRVS